MGPEKLEELAKIKELENEDKIPELEMSDLISRMEELDKIMDAIEQRNDDIHSQLVDFLHKIQASNQHADNNMETSDD